MAFESFKAPAAPSAPTEGAVARFLIAPLTFLSFLLSLALIDNANSSARIASHQPSSTGLLGKIRGIFRRILYKESPYAYVRNPDGGVTKVNNEEWYWHNNQRKMMRMEVVQAFDMRKWVVVVLVLGGLGATALAAIGGRWVLERGMSWF